MNGDASNGGSHTSWAGEPWSAIAPTTTSSSDGPVRRPVGSVGADLGSLGADLGSVGDIAEKSRTHPERRGPPTEPAAPSSSSTSSATGPDT